MLITFFIGILIAIHTIYFFNNCRKTIKPVRTSVLNFKPETSFSYKHERNKTNFRDNWKIFPSLKYRASMLRISIYYRIVISTYRGRCRCVTGSFTWTTRPDHLWVVIMKIWIRVNIPYILIVIPFRRILLRAIATKLSKMVFLLSEKSQDLHIKTWPILNDNSH